MYKKTRFTNYYRSYNINRVKTTNIRKKNTKFLAKTTENKVNHVLKNKEKVL